MKKLITEPTPTTLQGVFDRAWAWANQPSFEKCTEDDHCVYRNEDNTNACLIGCCITDDDYQPRFEEGTTTLRHIQERFFPKISVNHISALQHCHDDRETKDGVIENLKKFAAIHGLTINS